ncbi:cytochrome c-550 PedF [Undibacterium sp. SXout7W]|uniref:cytochrome c-550 PedF n=1 Tax=Undibacterium sp. SXout7W TaxID=3413049 RepID=UPI003BF0289F
MKTAKTILISRLAIALSCTFSALAFAHGDVTPQSVDTKTLPTLGEQWREENPYRSNKEAIRVGDSAFAQNCARCHGLQAVSGGIAPDLRMLDRDCLTQKDENKKKACFKEVDGYFSMSARRGKTRNGAVYMPPFEGILNQEAIWSIKAYLETVRIMPAVANAQPAAAQPASKSASTEKTSTKKKL